MQHNTSKNKRYNNQGKEDKKRKKISTGEIQWSQENKIWYLGLGTIKNRRTKRF